MARNEKSRKKNNSYRPNFWGMLQNVLIVSINKGQLPAAAISLILIIGMIKYPSDKIPELFDNLLHISRFNSIMGWIVAAITTFGGFFTARWLRRTHTKEIKRLSDEKKVLQEKLAKRKLPTSNN
jgi:formate hydrogenlyase subunit 3/multisubunit Na+/H+ antiporter MnhD subunit